MSDDSHGIDQVGSHYREMLQFADGIGITQIAYLEHGSPTTDLRFPDITTRTTELSEVEDHPLFAPSLVT